MSDDLFSVADKTVLVTGGANGLGRMIAAAFAERGAGVFLTSRKVQDAEATAAAIGATGLAADLSSAEGCTDLAARLKERTDRLDVLVNNAGKTWGAPLEKFPDKAWASVMAVNVQTPFTLVRDLLPLLEAAATRESPARVINIGSAAGKVVEPISAFSYSASKAAIHHLTRVVAAELAPRHVTVNCVVPGFFPTGMTEHVSADEALLAEVVGRIPLGRLGAPADIAGACLMLASAAGAYVTGSELVVDGGLSGCR